MGMVIRTRSGMVGYRNEIFVRRNHLIMWKLFSTRALSTLRIPSASVLRTTAVTCTAGLLLGGGLVANDASSRSLDGVTVDSSIDPFPSTLRNPKLFSSDYKLIATGVRSVTFLGFKVYGAGLYVPAKDEAKVATIVREHLRQNPGLTPEALLNDKELSQKVVSDLALHVPYAIKITPVRNTDFGHLRDGLTKSILASPMAKAAREEVAEGILQLREVFLGFRGSVPKNHTLWVCSNGKETSISYEGTTTKTLGVVTEPSIGRILLVLYLSSARPLSEPLRKAFVSYVGASV